MDKLLSPRLLFVLLAMCFAAGGFLLPKPAKQVLQRMEARHAENLKPRAADCVKIFVPPGLKISAGLCLLAAKNCCMLSLL